MIESDERRQKLAMLTALLFVLSVVSYTMYQNESNGGDTNNETVYDWIDPVYPAGPEGDANHSHGGSDAALLQHWLWTENMTLIDYHNLNCDGERTDPGGDPDPRVGRPCSPEFKNAEGPYSTPGDTGEIAIEGDFPECIIGCYAYIAGYNSMHILDISDLSNIQMVGTYWSSLARIIDVKVSKDQQWALINHELTNMDDDGEPLDPGPSDINPGMNAIDLIDISDKTAPEFSWRWQNPPAGYHNQEVYQYDNGDYFGFLADPYVEGESEAVKGTEIHKIDYANTGTLTMWGEYTPELSTTCGGSVFNHDNVVREHPITGQILFYGAYWDAGLRIVDVSNPPSVPVGTPNNGVVPVWNPPEIGRWLGCSTDSSGWYGPDGGGHGNMSVDTWLDAEQGNGNVHYVIPFDELVNGRHYTAVAPEYGSNAGHTGWIFLIDTTDPTKPFLVSKWKLPGDHQIYGGYMYSPHNGDTGNGHIYFAHYHAGAWITDAETVASTIVWKDDANIDYYDFDASDGDDTVYCENGDTGDCFNGFYEIEQLGRTDTLAYYLPHGPDWMENPYEKLDYESASDWTGGMIPFDWGLQYDPRGYVLISEISTGVYVVQFDGDINPEICVNSGVNCEFVCKNGNYDS